MLPKSGDQLETEQISFILGKNYVISFQEKISDHFEHIRERIREYKGISRERGSDFLLYLLLESIVDNYSETIETMEKKINRTLKQYELIDPGPEAINNIESFKEELFKIKTSIIPLKDSISLLENDITDFIVKKNQKYYFDIKDHCLYLIDADNALIQKLESGINLFFSYQGHRMNQVMKTLTVVATIFIPLTFIAGIYGMNFQYIPELTWQWGYFAFWGLIVILFAGMAIYFKMNKWF
jgi:magnesium transporter